MPNPRPACILDVVATGDASYAEMYEMTGNVIAEAGAGLGEPGPLIDALPAEELGPLPQDESTVVVTESEADGPSPDLIPAESRAGEPTLTMTGTLVSGGSNEVYDDTVQTELVRAFRATAGTVMLARVETCPDEGMVYMDVANVENGTTALSFPCDPSQLYAALMDDDDEGFDGESYVWLSVDGDYVVSFSVETETPTPITIEVFTDPTPTVVGQEDLIDGDQTTLSGVGDTLVYAFDGSASEAIGFTSTGLTEACALDAYGASEFRSGGLWSLAFCGHTESPGFGLTGAGFSVPVIVFARTSDRIDVTLTPTE